MLRPTLVFRTVKLRKLRLISLECARFRQDWSCCFQIKWSKGSRGATITVNGTTKRVMSFSIMSLREMRHGYTLKESKQKSSIWKHHFSPSPTKALISEYAGKVIANIVCDIQGIVLNHALSPKTTVTRKLVCDCS